MIENASFEEGTDGLPTGWIYPPRLNGLGYKLSLDGENALTGSQSALLDSTEVDSPNSFGLLNYRVDPVPLRGKRVRFRAAVKTAERSEEGRAQLWLRVDRTSGQIGAFDNMGGRPITEDDWDHYEIIVDVDDDAKALVFGMLVLGKCKAWIDDASFSVVGNSVAKTEVNLGGGRGADAARQPFFSHWLWLVAIALGLFAISLFRNSHLQRFALRFSIVYFLLYSFPTPFSDCTNAIVRGFGKTGLDTTWYWEKYQALYLAYQEFVEQHATWVANTFLGIEGDLVSSIRNGSGDTTIAYVTLLLFFAIALLMATVWSVAAIRFTGDHTLMRDLLRAYLRYVLAATMLSYGLVKAGFITTQFSMTGMPSEHQLARTYGASSPMGLLWTFMAASPMYTFFAGLGEVIGGVLLIFRRTMTLGALVTFGVMLNVTMLNFCYDVPVKQYSFHLMIMALYVAGPDFVRLTNLLVLNRPTESKNLTPCYVNPNSPRRGPYLVWSYRVAKALVVFFLVALPIFDHVKKEVTHEHHNRAESGHLLVDRGFRWINEYPFNR